MLDHLLGPGVRAVPRGPFWRPIVAQATLEALCDDPAFCADPGHHPAMFADHGSSTSATSRIGLIRLARHDRRGPLPIGRPPDRRRFVEHVRGRRRLPARHRHGRHGARGPADPPAVPPKRRSPVVARRWSTASGAGSVRDAARRGRERPRRLRRPPRPRRVRELLSLSAATASPRSRPRSSTSAALRRLTQRSLHASPSPSREATNPAARGRRLARRSTVHAAATTTSLPRSRGWMLPTGPPRRADRRRLDALRVLRAADVLRQRGTVFARLAVTRCASTPRPRKPCAPCGPRPGRRLHCHLRRLGGAARRTSRGVRDAERPPAHRVPPGRLRGRRAELSLPRRAWRTRSSTSRPTCSPRSTAGRRQDLSPPRRMGSRHPIELERPDDRHCSPTRSRRR